MTPEIVFHRHHIIPGHMGGTDEPRNVIRVNCAMHAFLHHELWKKHGKQEDLKAWQILTSLIGKDEKRRAAVSAFNKQRWATNPSYRAKMIDVSSHPSAALREQSSTTMKRLRSDPAFLRTLNEAADRLRSDPQTKAAFIQRMKDARAHPEARAQISANISAGLRAAAKARTPEARARASAVARERALRRWAARGH